MRTCNDSQETQNLLIPRIVQFLTCIHEHKVRQDLFLEANTDELKSSKLHPLNQTVLWSLKSVLLTRTTRFGIYGVPPFIGFIYFQLPFFHSIVPMTAVTNVSVTTVAMAGPFS